MSTENRIHLVGKEFRREEAYAAAAISPGDLIEITSAGKFQVHSTEGGYAERLVAIEDVLNDGKTISDDYSADDLVSANVELPGNEVQMYLKAGETAVIGSKLISAGDGTLIVNGSESSGVTVRQIIAISSEAKDLSGSGAVDSLIRVRLL
jgi:hypothetical protein